MTRSNPADIRTKVLDSQRYIRIRRGSRAATFLAAQTVEPLVDSLLQRSSTSCLMVGARPPLPREDAEVSTTRAVRGAISTPCGWFGKKRQKPRGAAMQVWAVSLNGYDDTTTSLAEAVANGTAV